MLSELHIENVAVIKNLTVQFSKGFSVLTGETGAGKSIIIDSVALVCGSRSSRDLIRSGADSATVSAVFGDLPEKAKEALAALDIFPDDDGNIYISRVITEDGKTRARIGGALCPAGTLKEAGKILLNIHGQHDSQQLLLTGLLGQQELAHCHSGLLTALEDVRIIDEKDLGRRVGHHEHAFVRKA